MGVPSSLLPRRVPQSPAVPQRTLRPETANRSHGSGTPESLCREIFARKAHADQLSRRFVGLSNICYTPINKFPQNSLW